MSDRSRSFEEPNLFDLPLEPDETQPPEGLPEERRSQESASSELPLFPAAGEPAAHHPRPLPPPEEERSRDAVVEVPAVDSPREPRTASLQRRWQAGLVDLGVHLALLAVAGLGAWLLGAQPRWADVGGLVLFVLVFSFLYSVYPLAFWGQTPGMLLAGVVARGGEHGALTFGQTALRWLGSLLTLATLGLASLLALFGGRSLTDRLSGTWTWERPHPH